MWLTHLLCTSCIYHPLKPPFSTPFSPTVHWCDEGDCTDGTRRDAEESPPRWPWGGMRRKRNKISRVGYLSHPRAFVTSHPHQKPLPFSFRVCPMLLRFRVGSGHPLSFHSHRKTPQSPPNAYIGTDRCLLVLNYESDASFFFHFFFFSSLFFILRFPWLYTRGSSYIPIILYFSFLNATPLQVAMLPTIFRPYRYIYIYNL